MKKTISVYGMYCSGCETVIEMALRRISGVEEVRADFTAGQVVVEYDPEKAQPEDIEHAVELAGYRVSKPNWRKYGLFAVLAAVMIILSFSKPGHMTTHFFNQNDLNYGLIFAVGLITGLHCVGMCGGLAVSVMPAGGGGLAGVTRPALLYNLGRVVSYTLTGVLLGALGSAFVLSSPIKTAVMIASALLMVLMGLNMAGIPVLRWTMLHVPAAWCLRLRSCRPLSFGLVTGFFPCGPLQIMQLYAVTTGSAFAGGIAMLVFSLGTIPAMLPVGLLFGALLQGHSRSLLRLNGLFIVVLGVLLAGRGLSHL
ncbi:MAG: sulfite exporter TauE/SafE family protein [Negativicutes bacterium]|nr:sulfite exporter TauE/SafE family protein [Negativicutes bacterium]